MTRPTSSHPSRATGSRRSRGLLALAAGLGVALGAEAALAAPPLRVEGRRFVDAGGRAVVLRGVNVAGNSKVPPFTPASDPAIFEPLRGWGMNVVRLLFTWEAYEPTLGVYDEAYLDYYAGAARAAHEHGLWVIVDFHQDAFSRFSIDGCGDGFPPWAVPTSVPLDPPDNGPACASWGVKMQSDADMMTSWQAFHAGESPGRAGYLEMVARVSERLSGEPGVIGYDLLNEPWGDEVTEIGPLYEEAAAAIREASPEAIVFVSPQALTSAGTQTELPQPSFANYVYSPHFYDASVVLFHAWSGFPPDEAFATMTSVAEGWAVPLFLGEFGAPGPSEDGDLYVDALYERLDLHLASGAQWVYTPGWTEAAKDGWNDEDFSIVDDTGAPRPTFRPRAYPAAVAGAPGQFRVTPAGAPGGPSVELEWEHDPSKGITEIFVPREALFGAESVTVETSGDGLECLWSGGRLLCGSPGAGPRTVRIRSGGAPSAESPACGLVGVELMPLALLAASRRRRRRRPRDARQSLPRVTAG